MGTLYRATGNAAIGDRQPGRGAAVHRSGLSGRRVQRSAPRLRLPKPRDVTGRDRDGADRVASATRGVYQMP